MEKACYLVVLICCFLSGCAGIPVEKSPIKAMPSDFVIMNHVLSDVSYDIKYHGPDNFVGTPVDGYQAPLCVLQKRAADGLIMAAQAATNAGYRLKILDCYRPQRAVDHFVRWAANLSDKTTKHRYYPNLPKDELLGPYIAERSGHSRGATVDVTLEKKTVNGWEEIDMGTPFDFFDPLSNTFNGKATDSTIENRRRLIDFMQAGDFVNYKMEWWHFSQQQQAHPNTYFDFPIEQ